MSREVAEVDHILQQIRDHMNEGFKQYGTEAHRELGVRGQFSDIWRKIAPLKRALWEGEELPKEQPREICLDLIGHAILTIMMLDELDETDHYVERPSFPSPQAF